MRLEAEAEGGALPWEGLLSDLAKMAGCLWGEAIIICKTHLQGQLLPDRADGWSIPVIVW